MNNVTAAQQHNKWILMGLQMAMKCLLVLFVTGCIGNLFVLCRILTKPSMRTINYFLIGNLCLSDFFMLIIELTARDIVGAMNVDNILTVECYIQVTVNTINLTTTNGVLLLLSLERFVLIVVPFRRNEFLSQWKRIGSIAFFYFISIAVLTAKLFSTGYVDKTWSCYVPRYGPITGNLNFGFGGFCLVHYPKLGYASDIVDCLLFFSLPNAIQLYLYARMGLHIRNSRQASSAPIQLKLAKMFFASSLVKIILWLPYEITQLSQSLGILFNLNSLLLDEGLFKIFIMNFNPHFIKLASVINPFVYIFLSPPMRSFPSEILHFFMQKRGNMKPSRPCRTETHVTEV